MAAQVVSQVDRHTIDAVVRRLHGLVTYGPWDLDIAWAMSAQGYDEVKWAEGQVVLAELLSSDSSPGAVLAAASHWCDEASAAARLALATQPRLLLKLGLGPATSD